MNELIASVFETPVINYRQISPILIVLGAAVISVLVEAFVPRESRRVVQLVLVFLTLITAIIWTITGAGAQAITAEGAIAVDGPGTFLQITILVISVFVAMLLAENRLDPAGDAFTARANSLPGSEDEREYTNRGWTTTELWPLFLFSIGGMLLFVVANDLLILFVALEVMSLPLYLMAAIARRRRLLSQEAAMKYFLLGAFGSAFFLYGSAMTYGFAGSIRLGDIANAISALPGPNGLIIAGVALLSVGMFFKIAAVPFHMWAPDVYVGAPMPVTAFMASCVKIAGVGVLLRVMYVAFSGLAWDWRPLFWIVSIVTMLVATILALTQTDIKRMLAYSSISHAGFLLIAIIALNPQGISSTLIYLVVYATATVGAFGIASLVRGPSGEATHLSQWAGLGKRSPLVAGGFAILLLSFAGIPLTAGFIGKFTVFGAGIAGGATPVVIVGAVASMIAAFFYVRVIVLMFFTDPAEDGPTVVTPSPFTGIAITVSVALTVIMGIFPQPLIDLAEKASIFIR